MLLAELRIIRYLVFSAAPVSLSSLGDLLPGDTPVVGSHFINYNYRCSWIFAQDVLQQLGDTFNQPSLIGFGDIFISNFDVYVWHHFLALFPA
jgi:hypothetical protein